MKYRIAGIRYMAVVVGTLSALAVLSVSTLAAGPGADAEPDVEPDVVREDSGTAWSTDIAILATEAGLPVGSVDKAMAFQEAFGKYASDLISRFPNQISAVWMDSPPGIEGPSTRGHVRFTGKVPANLTSMDNVVITGGGMISMADHRRRSEITAQILVELGYQNFATFFEPAGNAIRVELLLPKGASQPNKLNLLGAVQARVGADQKLQGRATLMEETDLALTFFSGSGPFVTVNHSRGGNWLRDDDVRECTSGWSVSGQYGNGIITAGHCSGLNRFEQPGVTPYKMQMKIQAYGVEGDVEYHTTSHVELAEFYSKSSTIRSVKYLKATSEMVGGSVCFYGRASNVRTCNHEVEAVNVTVSAKGKTVGNLARTTDTTSAIGGDSGGGWSFGNKAWGVQHGNDINDHAYFTPVEEAEDALNVTILTK